MPQVGKKHFPYTPAGYAAARREAARTGRPVVVKKARTSQPMMVKKALKRR